MNHGPKTKHMRRAVTVAYAALNVMYLNTFKAEKYSWSGYNNW
jgi:hypothetical protein